MSQWGCGKLAGAGAPLSQGLRFRAQEPAGKPPGRRRYVHEAWDGAAAQERRLEAGLGQPFEMSFMWSRLWNRFHICRSFRSSWTKSCYTPPTKPPNAAGETGPLWCATPCGNISAGWNCGRVRSATVRATRNSRKPARKRGVGNRRRCGRKNSPRKNSPR